MLSGKINCSDAKIGYVLVVDLETDKSVIENDPYACVTKTRYKYFAGWKSVGHVAREISYVYLCIKRVVINGVLSIAY